MQLGGDSEPDSGISVLFKQHSATCSVMAYCYIMPGAVIDYLIPVVQDRQPW